MALSVPAKLRKKRAANTSSVSKRSCSRNVAIAVTAASAVPMLVALVTYSSYGLDDPSAFALKVEQMPFHDLDAISFKKLKSQAVQDDHTCQRYGAKTDPYFATYGGVYCQKAIYQGPTDSSAHPEREVSKVEVVTKVFEDVERCETYFVKFWGRHMHEPIAPAYYINGTDRLAAYDVLGPHARFFEYNPFARPDAAKLVHLGSEYTSKQLSLLFTFNNIFVKIHVSGTKMNPAQRLDLEYILRLAYHLELNIVHGSATPWAKLCRHYLDSIVSSVASTIDFSSVLLETCVIAMADGLIKISWIVPLVMVVAAFWLTRSKILTQDTQKGKHAVETSASHGGQRSTSVRNNERGQDQKTKRARREAKVEAKLARQVQKATQEDISPSMPQKPMAADHGQDILSPSSAKPHTRLSDEQALAPASTTSEGAAGSTDDAAHFESQTAAAATTASEERNVSSNTPDRDNITTYENVSETSTSELKAKKGKRSRARSSTSRLISSFSASTSVSKPKKRAVSESHAPMRLHQQAGRSPSRPLPVLEESVPAAGNRSKNSATGSIASVKATSAHTDASESMSIPDSPLSDARQKSHRARANSSRLRGSLTTDDSASSGPDEVFSPSRHAPGHRTGVVKVGDRAYPTARDAALIAEQQTGTKSAHRRRNKSAPSTRRPESALHATSRSSSQSPTDRLDTSIASASAFTRTGSNDDHEGSLSGEPGDELQQQQQGLPFPVHFVPHGPPIMTMVVETSPGVFVPVAAPMMPHGMAPPAHPAYFQAQALFAAAIDAGLFNISGKHFDFTPQDFWMNPDGSSVLVTNEGLFACPSGVDPRQHFSHHMQSIKAQMEARKAQAVAAEEEDDGAVDIVELDAEAQATSKTSCHGKQAELDGNYDNKSAASTAADHATELISQAQEMTAAH